MTAVQASPARPPAPPEEPTTTEPARLPRSAIFADAVVGARRNLTRIARTPQLLVFATIQPVMFVLLFRYVFGGAIHVPGISYVDFLIPGVIVQTVVSPTWGRPAIRARSPPASAAALVFPPAGGRRLLTVSPVAGGCWDVLAALPAGSTTISPQIRLVHPPARPANRGPGVRKTPPGPPGA